MSFLNMELVFSLSMNAKSNHSQNSLSNFIKYEGPFLYRLSHQGRPPRNIYIYIYPGIYILWRSWTSSILKIEEVFLESGRKVAWALEFLELILPVLLSSGIGIKTWSVTNKGYSCSFLLLLGLKSSQTAPCSFPPHFPFRRNLHVPQQSPFWWALDTGFSRVAFPLIWLYHHFFFFLPTDPLSQFGVHSILSQLPKWFSG